jgi:hypothetical protein
MPKKAHTEEQIVAVLRQGQAGEKVADICPCRAELADQVNMRRFPDNHFLLLFRCVITVLMVLSLAMAQPPERPMTSAESDSSPEIERLVKTFGGEWSVVEKFEHSEFFPTGVTRKGTARINRGTGGTTVIEDYHSDGSAGRLDFLLVIWWDKGAKVYRLFTCANDVNRACELRGTARWEGDRFINDYEEMVAGKETKFQDSFYQTTPVSFTLVAAISVIRGSMQPLITTKYTRR